MAPLPPDPVGPLLTALIVTIAVTPVLSAVVLWRYRRAVGRSMRTTATRRPVAVPAGPAITAERAHRRARPAAVVVLDEGRTSHESGDDLWHRARRRLHTAAVVYLAAGLTSGAVLATVRLTVTGSSVDPRTLLVLTVLFAWPLVPTTIALTAAARPAQALVWAMSAVLLLLTTVGTGLTPAALGTLAALVVGPPAVLLLALGSRPLRAVGPFLAVPVLLTALGLLMVPEATLWAMRFGATAPVGTALAVLAAGLLGLAGFAHLAWAARQYARKRASDQMLTVSQWWFLAAAWQSVTLVPYGIAAAFAALASYAAFRVVLAVGMRLRPRPAGPPRRLLLLRTFGARRRSETLLRRLGAHWRHVGTVTMIAGPDLASAALEPHEFLDLLRGRLARRFIGTAAELRDRIGRLDDQPDLDRRFRVAGLFCHDDMWRPALQKLLRLHDCVLLDVRGFGRGNEGVTWEITQLAQVVPLDRVLVLVDDSTDEYLLRATLDRARAEVDPGLPESGPLRLLRTHSRHVDPAVVVQQLGRSR